VDRVLELMERQLKLNDEIRENARTLKGWRYFWGSPKEYRERLEARRREVSDLQREIERLDPEGAS